MESRESLPPPSLHHQPHLHHHHQPLPPGMMMSPNTYPPHTHHQLLNNTNSITSNSNKNPNLINPNSIQHQQRFSFDTSDQYGDGSSPSGGFRSGGYAGKPARKKRGRPRKYSPSQDGNIDLSLTPVPVTADYGNGNGNGNGTSNSDSAAKKHRGRPAGSGKKQLDALGVPGVGFTPHVIIVNAGEDIASTIISFSQQGPRTVCILSANGSISNVTLRQPASNGGTVTYEGRFEIISLSGSFLHSESDGNDKKPSGLSISLAGSDGRVLGGGVTGMLVAASSVQVIVGSFIAEAKKPKTGLSSDAPPPHMLSFGGGGGGAVHGITPPSEVASSESDSDESGSSHRIPGSYNNATQHQQQPQHEQQQQQSMQNFSMYSNMGWPNSTMNMLPN
ncbi:AT-hook motif nuclear-localized protein 10-like [Rutidosis leptorrhynchoides]|uniref:AT-hook motif nuclear-localized protein 10-like n=1 Tax=Rutidosis leptorrhynchoides TaxID=125765 RepID=UPI003A99CD43